MDRNVWHTVPFALGRQPLSQVRRDFDSVLLALLSKASVLRLCETSNLLRPSRMVLFASSKSKLHNELIPDDKHLPQTSPVKVQTLRRNRPRPV